MSVGRARRKGQRGFTLLEVLVASMVMGIAVAGVLSSISSATRNAARLSQYDRAGLYARSKMDELLVAKDLPRGVPLEGKFDRATTNNVEAGWSARVSPFETVEPAAPGYWVVDRVALEIWWMDGATKRSYSLEGYRRSILRGEDFTDGVLRR